jgi:hypothetical protein
VVWASVIRGHELGESGEREAMNVDVENILEMAQGNQLQAKKRMRLWNGKTNAGNR